MPLGGSDNPISRGKTGLSRCAEVGGGCGWWTSVCCWCGFRMEAAPKTGDAKPTTGIAGNAPPAKMKRKVSAEEDEHKRNSRLGKELIAYCIFLILFCVVTVVPIDDPNYEGLSYAMRDLMLETDHTSFNTNASFAGPKFAAVSSVSDYWKWLRGPFLHAIYMSDWYAGSPWSVGDQGLVAGNNLIVGTVRRERKEREHFTTLSPFPCLFNTSAQCQRPRNTCGSR
jgi:hypothetical protein